MEEVAPRQLIKALTASALRFRRGLPTDNDLHVPAVAHIFSAVLRHNFVTQDSLESSEDLATLQRCAHNGWLHTDNLRDIDKPEEVGYVFTSPLHRWFLEWRLFDTLEGITLSEDNIVDFTR